MIELSILTTSQLEAADLRQLRTFLTLAFGRNSDDTGDRFDDIAWAHCLGGTHYRLFADGALVSHVALVPRALEYNDEPLDAVYGESMATHPDLQNRGLGSVVVAAATAALKLDRQFGAFAASKYHFYERLGWERWPGTTQVRFQDSVRPAQPARGDVMWCCSPDLQIDSSGRLTADYRDGDIW